MEHENHTNSKPNKMGPDVLVETTDRDPHGNVFYHPSIFTFAVIGAVIGGIIMAFVAWMVADGSWAVVGLGQMSAGNRGPGAFLGFLVGSGIGGLVGAILGMRKMFRLFPPHKNEDHHHQSEKN